MVINTRKDFDALSPTEQSQFKQFLQGTLWRLERDDTNQTWVAIEDNNSIERFGFTRADFPNATPPELPVWEPIDNNVKVITKLQFVEWCEANNKLADLQSLLASNDIIKLKWDAATSLEITNQLVLDAAQAMSLDAQAVFNEIGNQL